MLRSFALLSILSAASAVVAYDVPLLDTDYSRQICSGMWSNSKTYLNVSFDSTSQGQVAMVIYEWKDSPYLGKVTSKVDDYLPKTYVCTSDAVRGGFCSQSQLGRFILDLPEGRSINDTSFWSARRQDGSFNPSPSGIHWYREPIQYLVRKTGYYCVAVVPVTVLQSSTRDVITRQNSTSVHPEYKGNVHFHNTFDGQLPATDYPKVNFYLAMFIVYAVLGGAWAWLCYRHLSELLPIQYYLSGLVGFLVIEMIANLAYYRYLNAHGKGTTSTVFLFVVAILDAGRNSLSFFMLLVVSLGLSVVRDELGRTMRKCQLLAGAHFIFGVLYAVGIVELEFESTSALVLLMFVIPLAFTLSGFLMWILYSLNATISQLKARKQHYKLRMFQRLHYILLFVVVVVVIFFVVSSLSFSGRLAEDYAAKTWKYRWWLLDGWLALLFLVAFVLIAYLWRPSANNRRLMMSDELAQDDDDAEDYDLESMQRRTMSRPRDDDEATLVGAHHGANPLHDDAVVFEIGDEDAHDLSDDEDDVAKQRSARRASPQHHEDGSDDERDGLMSGGDAPRKNRDD
ncbi:hypothetical protein HETIRDRAFT_468833 [Heterobasidion irregulare TC 32-1]|uniref:Uncharacterized protein n=1 Tax=Heterobasidion irregulare (strain TC 32-1) TaxID=747525 RepID=W4KPQ5_HETIT|nr:uncharacterized protein HETIRDRAFT_468833 [Heterobasidion irregulare TC 32-1]ETW87041.1 hypothetical protein HETIRDRAFT_468833 [Heterobasidion irregulare TC 32-1]